MTIENKREYAFLIYQKHKDRGITLKEIAERVGVHKNTITKWKKLDEWDEALQEDLSFAKQLRVMKIQLNELNQFIMDKPEGLRFPNKAESDARRQLVKDIAELLQGEDLATIVNVFMPFIRFVAQSDKDTALKIVEYQDQYVKTLAV